MSSYLTQAQLLPGRRGRDNFIDKGLKSCLAPSFLLKSRYNLLANSETRCSLCSCFPLLTASRPNSGIQRGLGFFLNLWESQSYFYKIISRTSFRGDLPSFKQVTCPVKAAMGESQGMRASSTCQNTLPFLLKSKRGRKIPDEGEGVTMSNHCRTILS